MAVGVTFPENEDVVTFWWKIERLVRVESKVDIYKKELGNYAGYRLRKVYWKDLHYWGMKISRDAVTHVQLWHKQQQGESSDIEMTILDLSINVIINLFISKEGNSYQVGELHQSTIVDYAFSFDLDVMRCGCRF